MKLLVTPSGLNVWWGIYKLDSQPMWDDFDIRNSEGILLARICLESRKYLEAGLEELKSDPTEEDFVQEVKQYLEGNKIYFYMKFMDKEDPWFNEVEHDAPVNEEGVKPSYISIWHPDSYIGLSTIQTGVKAFAQKFLKIEDAEVVLDPYMSFEEASATFAEFCRLGNESGE